MSFNLTLCTLCDKVNMNPASWRLCAGRQRAPRARPDPDAKRTIVSNNRDPSVGTIILFPYPKTSQGNKHLIDAEDVHTIDVTLFNGDGKYLLSSGLNLRIFDRDHGDVLGGDIDSAGLPLAIREFVKDSVNKTLQGYYVNRITVWNDRSWHVHTHPIFNHESGEAVGALMITEPYNKPIMIQTSASFVVGVGTPSPPHAASEPS